MKTTPRMTKRFAVLTVVVAVFFAWSCDQFENDIVPDETKTTVDDTDFFSAPNASTVIDLKSLVKSHSNVTLTITDQPNHGELAKIKDAVFSYTPDEDFTGTDFFVFSVKSGAQTVATDSVVIKVDEDAGEIPCGLHAMYDSAIIPFSHFPTPRFVKIDVLGNDIICGVEQSNLKLEVFSPPGHGEVAIETFSSKIVYYPNSTHQGPDAFIYKVSDKNDTTNYSLAMVSVWTEANPTCEIRVNPDSVHFLIGQSNVYTFNVFTNDEFCLPDSVNDAFMIINAGEHGSSAVAGFGLIRYEATEASYALGDSITYKYCKNDVCYTAGVRINFGLEVCEVLARGDTVDIPLDATLLNRYVEILDNDIVCAGVAEIGIIKSPMHGTASMEGNILFYKPNSQTSPSDSVRYMVCDWNNKCGQATLIIRRE